METALLQGMFSQSALICPHCQASSLYQHRFVYPIYYSPYFNVQTYQDRSSHQPQNRWSSVLQRGSMFLNSLKGIRTSCHLSFSASSRSMLLLCRKCYFPQYSTQLFTCAAGEGEGPHGHPLCKEWPQRESKDITLSAHPPPLRSVCTGKPFHMKQA